MTSGYLENCLKRKLLFFTGKGGVGKSALAWATAAACVKRGRRVQFIHWNPYHAIALRSRTPGIEVVELEPLSCFKEYVVSKIKFEKIYDVVFENHVLQSFIRVAPGLADTVIAGKIWDLYSQSGPDDLIVVDLPSSGHAVSFFQSPLGVHKMFRFGFVHQESEKICNMFLSPNVRIDIVAIPEELPIQEAKELKQKLEGLGSLPLGFLLMNQCLPDYDPGPFERFRHQKEAQESAMEGIADIKLPIVKVPRFPVETTHKTIECLVDYLGRA